jgi:hypothetical protein
MNRTIVADIRNNAFPTITVPPDTYVVWRNLDPYPHSAETEVTSDFFFNAGPMLPGEASAPVLFTDTGTTHYRCRYHPGMDAMVTVAVGAIPNVTPAPDAGHGHGPGHGHGGFAHLHGFVTGGRSGTRFFMSHTPVLADPRHSFQVILQGSLKRPDHIAAYDKIRNSSYEDRRIQIFHSHMSLPDIANGTLTTLPESSFTYYPDLKHPDDGVDIPGLEENIPVAIDRVLHFHKFDTEAPYPDALEYLVYGDLDDIFIDHFMNRGPSFHSVAKLAARPAFWDAAQTSGTVRVRVPKKCLRELCGKFIQRLAFVDNSFHVFWLPPSGLYTPAPQDPLFPRKPKSPNNGPYEFTGGPFKYDVVLEDGRTGNISVGRSLHFDVRLLNHGVFLPDNA